MFEFTVVDIENINIDEYDDFANKNIFTRLDWLYFLRKDSNIYPCVLKVIRRQDKCFVGYLTGGLFSRFGVKIFASPFSGWSTCFMGYDLTERNELKRILLETRAFLFEKLGCMYAEIIDREISIDDAKLWGFDFETVSTLELKIDRSDEELFKVFKTDCRNFIRQFERRGATIERVTPNEEFAKEYYNQLEDVFAKQGMVPTYGLKKVVNLMDALRDTEMLLCLRVRNPEGRSIATSIFLGHNKKFFFWGGASLREYQQYRPNEYMIWHAIKYWREQGITVFDMVGVREYKRKFGALETQYAKLIFSRARFLIHMKNFARRLYFLSLRFRGCFIGKKVGVE